MSIKTNDPLLAQQWHLNRIGVDKIFDEYRGAGVKVGVYDTAIQSSHVDLKQNYLAALEMGGGSASPGSHGTAVAGIIAAAANDGVAGVGVASAAGVAGVNIYGTSDTITSAMQQLTRFDVVNNSWGWTEALRRRHRYQLRPRLRLGAGSGAAKRPRRARHHHRQRRRQ